MTTRTTLFIALALSATSALAAPPPKPVMFQSARANEEQTRGWEAVGKLLLGQQMMLRARELCGPELTLALSPEQAGQIVEAAVGRPVAEVSAAIAAPGWFQYIANRRVDKLLIGGPCDADTASFIASEIDSIVAFPADELSTRTGLGKTPPDKWVEFAGQKREHQVLVYGVFGEIVGSLSVTYAVGRTCATARPRVDAIMARADAATQAMVGIKTTEMMVVRPNSPDSARMMDSANERARSLVASFGGCVEAELARWLDETEQLTATLFEKHAGIPALPPAWHQSL